MQLLHRNNHSVSLVLYGNRQCLDMLCTFDSTGFDASLPFELPDYWEYCGWTRDFCFVDDREVFIFHSVINIFLHCFAKLRPIFNSHGLMKIQSILVTYRYVYI